MSKGLEALENLKEGLRFYYHDDYFEITSYPKDFAIIENELIEKDQLKEENLKLKKALEIINEKVSDISWFKCCNSLEDYNNSVSSYRQLTQEEYDLLKGVLYDF